MFKILNDYFEHLDFGHCNLFGACDFGFVILLITSPSPNPSPRGRGKLHLTQS